MKTYLRIYLDPIQQKVVKELCKANIERAKYCHDMALQSNDTSIACDFYNEYLAMKYLLETIESGKDEVLSHVR